MTRTPFRELPEFKRGRAAEQRVSAWLQERGWHVIPSYDYSGGDGSKPPRLQGYSAAYPVPDLDTAAEGRRRWVEVKLKRQPMLWRKTGQWQHGIELRLLESYLKVQEITGTPVWLVIYEEIGRRLIGQSVDVLGTPRIGTEQGRRIANWDRRSFVVLHQFEDGSLCPGSALTTDSTAIPRCSRRRSQQGACG